MGYLIGAGLALAAGGFATLTGLDRDRAFYPTVMIVIALTYALFAVMGGADVATLSVEVAVITVFVAAAIVGFKYSLWLVAAALAAHGILDAFHDQLIANPGVPVWWPQFCSAYDVAAAAYLGGVLLRRRTTSP